MRVRTHTHSQAHTQHTCTLMHTHTNPVSEGMGDSKCHSPHMEEKFHLLSSKRYALYFLCTPDRLLRPSTGLSNSSALSTSPLPTTGISFPSPWSQTSVSIKSRGSRLPSWVPPQRKGSQGTARQLGLALHPQTRRLWGAQIHSFPPGYNEKLAPVRNQAHSQLTPSCPSPSTPSLTATHSRVLK